MTDDECVALLRATVQPVSAEPSLDLWPAVVERSRTPLTWSWVDLAIAAAVIVSLIANPQWLRLLAYHL
jgi:hypothetical protein